VGVGCYTACSLQSQGVTPASCPTAVCDLCPSAYRGSKAFDQELQWRSCRVPSQEEGEGEASVGEDGAPPHTLCVYLFDILMHNGAPVIEVSPSRCLF
jgi:hypothetical protein